MKLYWFIHVFWLRANMNERHIRKYFDGLDRKISPVLNFEWGTLLTQIMRHGIQFERLKFVLFCTFSPTNEKRLEHLKIIFVVWWLFPSFSLSGPSILALPVTALTSHRLFGRRRTKKRIDKSRKKHKEYAAQSIELTKVAQRIEK